jgi:cyclophilin family peptidyl-prolyl cis-trans isomerase
MSNHSYIRLFLCLVSAFIMAAQQPAPTPAAAPKPPALPPGLYATIQTSMGNITLRLFDKESPITVKNFTDLAMGRKEYTDPRTRLKSRKPLYNGLTFHRVVPGFMIQGGDPLGSGGGGTEPIKDEFAPTLKFEEAGVLAMANAGPGTGSCQFFITVAPAPHLNGHHTIFGKVVEGQDVVNKIVNVPRLGERPRTAVRIIRVSVRREGPSLVAPAVKKAVPAAKPATSAVKPAASKSPNATKK